MKLTTLFMLSLFLLIPVINSTETYYADIVIKVEDTGLISITGVSNFEPFIDKRTQMYTSQSEDLWLLNISYDVLFSDYIFRLILPENSAINFIRTTPDIRFEVIDSRINIVGVANNRNFNLIVQYSITDQIDEKNSALPFVVGLLFILMLTFYLSKLVKKNVSDTKNNKFSLNKQEILNQYSYLPERQQEIIRYLLENDGTLTQKKLEDLMRIPKSSLSRNISTLEIKKILEKKQSGNSNILKLKI